MSSDVAQNKQIASNIDKRISVNDFHRLQFRRNLFHRHVELLACAFKKSNRRVFVLLLLFRVRFKMMQNLSRKVQQATLHVTAFNVDTRKTHNFTALCLQGEFCKLTFVPELLSVHTLWDELLSFPSFHFAR